MSSVQIEGGQRLKVIDFDVTPPLDDLEIQKRVGSLGHISPYFLQYGLGGSQFDVEKALDRLADLLREEKPVGEPLLVQSTAREALAQIQWYDSPSFPLLVACEPKGIAQQRDVLFYDMRSPRPVYFFGDTLSQRLFMQSVASGIQETIGSSEKVEIIAVGEPSDIRHIRPFLSISHQNSRDAVYRFDEIAGIRKDMSEYLTHHSSEHTIVLVFDDGLHNDDVVALLTPALHRVAGLHVIISSDSENYSIPPRSVVFAGAGCDTVINAQRGTTNFQILPTQVVRADNLTRTAGTRYWMFAT